MNKFTLIVTTIILFFTSCNLDENSDSGKKPFEGTWSIFQGGETTLIVLNETSFRIMDSTGLDSKGTLSITSENTFNLTTTHINDTSINDTVSWMAGSIQDYKQAGHFFDNSECSWAVSQNVFTFINGEKKAELIPYTISPADYLGDWRQSSVYIGDNGDIHKEIKCIITEDTYVYEEYHSDGFELLDKGTVEILSNFTLKWTQTHIKNSGGVYEEVTNEPWSGTFYVLTGDNGILMCRVDKSSSLSFYETPEGEQWPLEGFPATP